MKFIQLTDAYKQKKILINLENVIRISEHFVWSKGRKVASTLIEFVRPDEYVTVQESYEDVKEIIEKGL